ncbi:MAG: 4-hydroxy-3-methylbut-2-enyl diphosphate reductase [Deltaproteobacteria bacterium GWA2_47_9]|nr:MAG: 4-hydroxy-3-methylbut-2-enyl diphosphate reductase [Deltaproteobacteria bacterium GWA2_47_9]
MEIILAKSAGFCFGVKRATKMAFQEAESGNPDTYTLGSIIHNPQVVDKLASAGVSVKNDVENINQGTVIIRSHGVTLDEIDRARKKGLRIVDATCPFVKKAQDLTTLLREEGYFVVIVGDEEHPEVKSIISYGGKDVIVVNSPDKLETLPKKKKIGVVAQTTQSFDNLKAIVNECLGKVGELRVFNTICGATAIRQDQSRDIALEVDCMIVVGGYSSANTNRLAEICKSIQPNTHHVEVAAELDSAWFSGVKRVGVTAGASTPEWIIDDVVKRIKEYGETQS